MYLLFDIGGTKIRLAKSLDGKSFSRPAVIPTPQNFSVGVRALAQLTRQASGGRRVGLICGGVAGRLDGSGVLWGAPNLPGWVGRPLKHSFKRALGAPLLLENDAALAALGEAVRGAGKGFKIVAYLTFSTGVGGARVVSGRIDHNALGFAPGRQIIDLDDSSGRGYNPAGDLEGYTSGAALAARYGRPPEKISEPKIWQQWVWYAATGVSNTLRYWSPDAVVLGGSLITKGPRGLLTKINSQVAKHINLPRPPRLLKAALGDFGGLYGALELIKQNQSFIK